MAVEIGALRAMLSLDSAAFERGAKRAEASMSNLQRRFSRVGRSLRSFGTTMSTRVTAPMVAGFGLMARSAFNSAFEIERMAQLSNSGLVEFQRFAAGARDVGVEQDKLSDILKDTNDRIGDFIATGGGPMADFFENIAPKVGVTAEQFAKLSGPEALQLYVSSLEKAGLNQQEMTFYMEALASDATALLPLLRNNGAEMDRLADSAENAGAVMKAETITALNNSREALRAAGDAAKGLSQQFMAALAPAFERIAEMAQGLSEWFSGLSPQVKTVMATVAGLAAALGPLALAIGGVSSAISVLMGAMTLAIPAVVALGGPLVIIAAVIGTVAAGMALFGDKTEIATPHLDAAEKAQVALNAALGTFSDTSAPSAAAEAINLANDMAQEAKKAMDAAKAQIALAEARQAALASSIDTARTQGMRQRADEQAARARERLAAAEDALAEAERARDRVAREVTGGPMTLPSVKISADDESGDVLDDAEESAQGLMDGLSGASGAASGLSENLKGVNQAAQNLTPISDKMKSLGSTIAGYVEGPLMSVIDTTKDTGEAFRKMAANIIKELYRVFVVKKITGFIEGAIGGMFGGGSPVPNSLASATRSAFPSLDGGGYTGNDPRTGGLDGKGGFMAMLHPRETVVDHTKGQGNGVTVNQTINISTGVQQTVRTEIKSLMPQIAESAKGAVADAKLRGGSYGRAF